MRSFWKGDDGLLPAFASGFLGSADRYDRRGRRPWASVDFITAHVGFTLADLWSYNEKHNEANQENNQDGHNDNRSWNCGVEGPTDDPTILDLRDRLRRGLMATLLLSHGTPMILMGDERGHSQNSNNAYCQDNPLTWIHWSRRSDRDRAFQRFVRGLIALRRARPLLRCATFLHGDPVAEGLKSVTWLRPDGAEMTPESWGDPFAKVVGLLLASGDSAPLLLLVSAFQEALPFQTPAPPGWGHWRLMVDTGRGLVRHPPGPGPLDPDPTTDPDLAAGDSLELPGRTLLLFEGVPHP